MNTIDSPHSENLLQRQQQLVEAIFNLPPTGKQATTLHSRGLKAYQNNLRMTAARALSISYPVIAMMLGEKAMRILAQQLLLSSPPREGDWAEWGGELASHLQTEQISKDSPYLIDMAKMEWHIHRINRARLTPAPAEQLSLLTEHDLSKVRLHLSPALAFLSSTYPIDAIWQAHQVQDQAQEGNALNLYQLKRAIQRNNGDCFLLIYQHEHKAAIKRISQQEFLWFNDIAAGYSLAALLTKYPNFDFIHWLPDAVGNNLIKNLSIH